MQPENKKDYAVERNMKTPAIFVVYDETSYGHYSGRVMGLVIQDITGKKINRERRETTRTKPGTETLHNLRVTERAGTMISMYSEQEVV